jgi:hypothetical protein
MTGTKSVVARHSVLGLYRPVLQAPRWRRRQYAIKK